MQAVAAASAVPAVASAQSAAEVPGAAAEAEAPVEVTATLHDAAGVTMPQYFEKRRYAALRRICDLLAPRMENRPGALDADVPEFLDFHVSVSPADRRDVYAEGLDTLNSLSLRRFSKDFAEISAGDADALIAAPLAVNWTPQLPDDPLAAFLRTAKEDVLAATMNSREFAEATEGQRRRGQRRQDVGLYWYTMD